MSQAQTELQAEFGLNDERERIIYVWVLCRWTARDPWISAGNLVLLKEVFS